MKNSQLRVFYSQKIQSGSLTNSDECHTFFAKIWDKSLINLQEQIYILYLNNLNQVIGWRCLNSGTDTESIFFIKFALACGLNCMASKIVIAHNHPSGQLNPSLDDITMTRRLLKAAELMDIKLIDHIILAPGNYFSFKDHEIIF